MTEWWSEDTNGVKGVQAHPSVAVWRLVACAASDINMLGIQPPHVLHLDGVVKPRRLQQHPQHHHFAEACCVWTHGHMGACG